jgi:hypothetical protein
MMKTLQKLTLRDDSLEEIHKSIETAESKGWKKASGLLYVYEDGYQGWEMVIEKEVSIDEPSIFEDGDDYIGVDSPEKVAPWFILGAAIVGATIILWVAGVFS